MAGTHEYGQVPAFVIKNDEQDLAGKEVCLFVSYCPNGEIGPGLEFFLSAIKSQNIFVILCLISEGPQIELASDRLAMCSAVLYRQNIGYDFAAWAAMLRALPDLWNARRLYFSNDSILGPNKSFPAMIEKVRSEPADFIALTANWMDTYHAQSYFFVLNERAIKNHSVQDFWLDLPDYESKRKVIILCEQRQLALYQEIGLKTCILFDEVDAGCAPLVDPARFNPTHHAWRHLLEAGFPFMKADMFYRPSTSPKGWSGYFDDRERVYLKFQLDEIVQSRFPIMSHISRNAGSKGALRRFGLMLRSLWKRFKCWRSFSGM